MLKLLAKLKLHKAALFVTLKVYVRGWGGTLPQCHDGFYMDIFIFSMRKQATCWKLGNYIAREHRNSREKWQLLAVAALTQST